MSNGKIQPPSANIEQISVQELLSYHLIRLGRRLDLLQSRIAHREGLSLIGLKLLFLFDTKTPSTLSDAIRETSLDVGQASRAITQLIELGLMRQVESTKDKRRKKLLLTPTGASLKQRSMNTRAGIEQLLCQVAGEDQVDELKDTLEAMLERLTDMEQTSL